MSNVGVRDKKDKTPAREKTIEKKLVKAVRAVGGIAPKLVSPGFDGMPDRMVLLPKGRMGFVEVKAPGKKPRPFKRQGLSFLNGWALMLTSLTGRNR